MKIQNLTTNSNKICDYEDTSKLLKCLTYGEIKHSLIRPPTAILIQQNYCENLTECEWEEYDNKKNQFKHIRKNIAFAVFGSPIPKTEPSTSESPIDQDNLSDLGYSNDQIKHVEKIHKNIVSFGKYSAGGERIYMSKLFACCVPLQKSFSKSSDLNLYAQIESFKIAVSPIFKIRKCIRNSYDDISPCCSYIDDHGRVYNNWDDYLVNNKLPKGVLVLPKNGKYKCSNIEGVPKVDLDIVLSPASSTKSKILNICNKVGTGVGLTSAGVFATAIFLPVAAPVMITAGVATLATGAFGTTVSSLALRDRANHQQTISPTDVEARSCWLNIGANTFGIASSASSQILAASISRGIAIGQIARGAHNGLLFASTLTNGLGITHGVYVMIDKYKHNGETPTTLEWLHMSSSILFFCHSIVNIKTASAIIEETQLSTIEYDRSMLRSNRHRRMFDKMAAETRRRLGDDVKGNTEIIRSMRVIADKDTFFASTLRMNKQLNQNKIRISFSGTDEILLNGQHNFKPDVLISLNESERLTMLSSIGPSKLAAKNSPTKITFTKTSCGIPITCYLSIKTITRLIDICSSKDKLEKFVGELLESLTEEGFSILYEAILELCPIHFEKLTALGFDNEDLYFTVYKVFFDIIKNNKFLDESVIEFLERINYCRNRTTATSKFLVKKFLEWLKLKFSETDYIEVTCTKCNGSRFSK